MPAEPLAEDDVAGVLDRVRKYADAAAARGCDSQNAARMELMRQQMRLQAMENMRLYDKLLQRIHAYGH